ncbi:MAG: hypothetical protein AMS18_00005, partial [Gemmatimonas sp. SG8_17]
LTGDPGATPTFRQIFTLIFMTLRNKSTQDGSWLRIFNNTGTAIIKAAVSDIGGLFTRDKMQDGP